MAGKEDVACHQHAREPGDGPCRRARDGRVEQAAAFALGAEDSVPERPRQYAAAGHRVHGHRGGPDEQCGNHRVPGRHKHQDAGKHQRHGQPHQGGGPEPHVEPHPLRQLQRRRPDAEEQHASKAKQPQHAQVYGIADGEENEASAERAAERQPDPAVLPCLRVVISLCLERFPLPVLGTGGSSRAP